MSTTGQQQRRSRASDPWQEMWWVAQIVAGLLAMGFLFLFGVVAAFRATNADITIDRTSLQRSDFDSLEKAKKTIDSLAPAKYKSLISTEYKLSLRGSGSSPGDPWWYVRPISMPTEAGWGPLRQAKEQRLCIGADEHGVYLYDTRDDMDMWRGLGSCTPPRPGADLSTLARWQLGANGTWVKPTSPVQKSGKTESSKEQVTLWR